MKHIKAPMSLVLGIIIIFSLFSVDCFSYRANAMESGAFYNMMYVSIGEYIYLVLLDRENLKEFPEESRPLMIIGALGGLILGNYAFQVDSEGAGNYSVGYGLAYPLYLIVGSLTGAITGVAVQQTYRKIFPLQENEEKKESSDLFPKKTYHNIFKEISKDILLCDKYITEKKLR